MEIERRFLVKGFPKQQPMKCAHVEQGYLSVGEIEVRIRRTVDEVATSYKLCFKSEGTLSREEVEFEIEKAQYEALLALLSGEMIEKDYRVYALGDYQLEVCQVDAGTPRAYYYAEVEFEDEQQALAFDSRCIPGLLKEVTYDQSYNMKRYWQATRGI